MSQDAATDTTEQARFLGNESTPPAGESATPAAPVEQPAPAPAPEATPAPDSPPLFEGTQVNPDELIAQHPELEPLVKQFQAEWTRKTQGLAEQRKQVEALGPVEELQQAVDLVNRISDPTNWAELHANLTAAMQEQGLLPAEPGTPTPKTPGLEEVTDPELAPVMEALKAQQAELAQLKAAREHEARMMEVERQRQQMIGNLQQQENEIVATEKNYEQDDIDMVYQLGSFFNADLNQAHDRLEAYVARRIESWAKAKQTSSPQPGPAPKPAATNVHEDGNPKSLKEIGSELEEHMRQLQAAGEFD